MKISIIPLTLIILLSLTVHTTLQGQKRSTESRMSMLSQKIVSAVDIEEKIDGQKARVTTVELVLQPNEESQPHRHPGPVSRLCFRRNLRI